MKTRYLLAVAAAALLAGCASDPSGSSYTRAQTRGEMLVRMGVVEGVRAVRIEGTQTGLGAATGAAVGGLAGSSAGHGKGSTIGAVLGAVAGGVAGNALEGLATKEDGVEITVKLDSGQIIAITQGTDDTYKVGERVRIISGQGVTRVAR